MQFFPWESEDDEDLEVVNKTPASLLGTKWKLTEGISCKDWMTEDVVFELDPNRGIKLSDSIPNTLNIHIVSEKLKDILDASGENIEFFPVTILNPKGKKISKPYFIANVVGSVKCMDLKSSEYRESAMDKGQMTRVSRLVLDEEKIPEGKQIFRLGEMTELLIVAEPLALKIAVDNKCTGVNMTYLEDYGEEFR